ncbi:hypothetical protein ACFLU5_14095 [Bacteroidota bacterium]
MKYLITILVALPGIICAQERPGLFFREDFKEIPEEIPITQEHISNPDLLISLYGKGADVIKKSHHDTPADDPYYVWSGLCEGNWAVTLKHKSKYVDLSGQSKIRWRSKQSGFRQLHIILKLADGTWLVSNALDPISGDWRIREFNIPDLHWMTLDIETVAEKKWLMNPDLSKVEEIGWTDLMRGGGSEACSRVDWIEVDGIPVD